MIEADRLADEYLRRLAQASQSPPAERRDDLLDGVREHVEQVRAAAPGDAVGMRQALDRLGEPEDIVRATREPSDPEPPRRRGTGHELAAVLMLTAGSLFVPLVGWLVGVVLLWTSSVWRTREKVVGTLVVPGGLGLFFFLAFVAPTTSCSSDSETLPEGVVITSREVCEGLVLPTWVAVPLAVLLVGAPLVTAIALYRRASRRVAAGR